MLEKLKASWAAMNENARRGVLIGSVVIGVLTVVLLYWVLQSGYRVLFADLDPRDATAIVSELDKMKVPYELEDGGTKILVKEDAVHKTRLKLMGKDVPLRGGVGFEIFDHSDFGITEFAQKINFQRALQGELARTIMAFDEVKFARVHLVLPESGLFRQSKASTKASVTLMMKDDKRLRPEQVVGIQRLVAAAVPGLDAGQVTVLDQRGTTLTRNDDGEGAVSSRLDTKKEIENYLTRKVVEVLDRTFGPGQAIVSVDATLNLDQVKSTLEDVIPLSTRDGEALGAVARRKQSVQGQSTPRPIATADGETSYAQVNRAINTVTETDYQLSRRVDQIVSMPGGLRRLSVGVLVPQHYDDERMAKLREVIAMTVGLNPARGDAIAVHSVAQFARDRRPGEGGASATDTGRTSRSVKPSEDPLASTLKHPWNAGMLLVTVASLLLVAFVFHKRKVLPAGGQQKNLNQTEREVLLAETQQWLGLDRKSPEGVKK